MTDTIDYFDMASHIPAESCFLPSCYWLLASRIREALTPDPEHDGHKFLCHCKCIDGQSLNHE